MSVASVAGVSAGSSEYAGHAGRIHYRWWLAEEPRFVVLLAHGFGDHSGRWQRYGERVAAAGGAVLACDHLGHGLSEGKRAAVDSFDLVAADFLKLLDVPERPPDLPVILAGHSMGGLVVTCAATAAAGRYSALVVSGARIGGWETAETLLARIESGEVDPASGVGHPLLDPNATLPVDALSRDPEIGKLFVGDDLAYKGPYPIETLKAFVAASHQLRSLDRVVEVPILYMHGGADPITPYQPSVARIVQLAAGDLEIRIFGGARHSIYNEINRDEIYDVLLRFVERVTA